jgi:FkbM family methyltransferase
VITRNLFSQLGQENWVLDMLKYKKCGVFIDIGAGDGLKISNTYALEKEYGWHGICVEPSRQYHSLKKIRKAICIDSIVWHTDNEEVEFIEDYKNGEENWFSGIKSQFDCHEVAGIEYLKRTKTLQSLIEQNNIGNHIDYLSIDTEGSEYEIIKNFPFNKFKIDLITIEHNYVQPKRQNIFELLSKNGFIRQEIIDSKFDDWYYHESLLENTEFLIRRQEELYRKTFEIKNSEEKTFENYKSNFESILLEKDKEISFLIQSNSNQLLEIESQKMVIADIKKSLSWRLTKPLRILGTYFLG